MGLFDDLKERGADFRVSEEVLYAEALRELKTGEQRNGAIWAMALVGADMDHAQASVNYIRMRVQSLKGEIDMLASAAKLEAKQREVKLIQSASAASRRHTDCGGLIVRTMVDTQVTWTCRKCHSKVAFERGGGRA